MDRRNASRFRRTRRAEAPPVRLTCGDLVLDEDACRVWRGDDEVILTPTEFRLLRYLLHNRNRVVSKGQILEHVWDFAFEGDPNIVEVYVRQLRLRIDEPFGRASLQTVRLAGYRLDPDGG